MIVCIFVYVVAQASKAFIDETEIYEVIRSLRPQYTFHKTAAAADAAAGQLLREEAIILQSMGEGPVEELQDVRNL